MMRRVNHGIRITVLWLIVSAIFELLVAVLPIPSPANSREALGAHQTIYMLFYVGAPVAAFVWVMLLYEVIVFRRRPTDPDEDRPAPPDSTPILLLWAGISFTIVLFLAGWGTFTLHEITDPQGTRPLVVQVIGQQWQWTFRYPSYGGMETRQLYVPAQTAVRFDITSLDVVHSFWIYDYDIKEDAVPGVTNTAWFYAKNTGQSTPEGKNWIVCNELFVVPRAQFATWATGEEARQRADGLIKNLGPYAPHYYPQPDWPPPPQDTSP